MCSHYQALKLYELGWKRFGVAAPAALVRAELWPGYVGAFVRRHAHADLGDAAVPEREVLAGVFGLLPRWSKDLKLARHTFNARSETVSEKPSFRDAWRKGQRCIIPAQAIYEPDWRTGKAVPTRISRADGAPMGLAGLWDWSALGGGTLSYTMLTINADEHPFMNQFHRPQEEKRSVVILPDAAYADWLDAAVADQGGLLQLYPAHALTAST